MPRKMVRHFQGLHFERAHLDKFVFGIRVTIWIIQKAYYIYIVTLTFYTENFIEVLREFFSDIY